MRGLRIGAMALVLGVGPALPARAGSPPGASEETTVAADPVVFWELASHDAEASVAFLNQVFGWNLRLDERLKFHVMAAPPGSEGVGGGVFTLKKAKLPFLTLYIQVVDIEAKVKRIEELGGYIVEPPKTLDGGSRICLFNEPSGVTFAMIQPAPAKRE